MFVIEATSAEDLRRELLSFFLLRQREATTRAAVANQSRKTRDQWIIRANVAGELHNFLTHVTIEPKKGPSDA